MRHAPACAIREDEQHADGGFVHRHPANIPAQPARAPLAPAPASPPPRQQRPGDGGAAAKGARLRLVGGAGAGVKGADERRHPGAAARRGRSRRAAAAAAAAAGDDGRRRDGSYNGGRRYGSKGYLTKVWWIFLKENGNISSHSSLPFFSEPPHLDLLPKRSETSPELRRTLRVFPRKNSSIFHPKTKCAKQ